MVWQENSGQSFYWQPPPPRPHSHANTKALSRCNPQLLNQKIRILNVCPTFLYQSSATDPIWLNFLLLPDFFDPKNRSPPPSLLLSIEIETNLSQFFFLSKFREKYIVSSSVNPVKIFHIAKKRHLIDFKIISKCYSTRLKAL